MVMKPGHAKRRIGDRIDLKIRPTLLVHNVRVSRCLYFFGGVRNLVCQLQLSRNRIIQCLSHPITFSKDTAAKFYGCNLRNSS
jgi:hypothetical protein